MRLRVPLLIAPVLVAPAHDYVIGLQPELITPQDGAEKQDGEQAAYVFAGADRVLPT